MVLKASKRKITAKKAQGKFKRRRVGIVMSLFNDAICSGLKNGAMNTFLDQGIVESDITILEVPGAFEIPLVAKKLAKRKDIDGVVALGCVIRGDTPHFEFVSLAATMGCLNAMLDVEKPICFGIITVNNQAQAVKRSSPDEFNKGREAALALLDTLQALENC